MRQLKSRTAFSLIPGVPFLFRRPSLPSIRSRLITLVLACALPILAGYFAFARDAARREREHIAQDAQTIARTLVAAVERDIASSETAAKVLANSGLLDKGLLAEFHSRVRMLLRPNFPAHAFALYDAGGRQVLNTRAPFGTKLASDGNEEDVRRVFASGYAVATGLRQAGPGQPQLMTILVPVWRDGQVVNALGVQLRPRQLADLLAAQHLPGQWVAEVYDHEQRSVARSADPLAHLGARMPAPLVTRLREADAGIAAADDSEGSFMAYARSPSHRWTVAVIVPPDAAPVLLGHSKGTLVAGVVAMLGMSLGFAWLIGGTIARSVRALIEPAAALGRGEEAAVPVMSISEAEAVAVALRKVDGKLQRYKRGLASLVAERTAELERSNACSTGVRVGPGGPVLHRPRAALVMVNDYLAA
jgi:two-component system sensor histidine kinase/response regulator